MIKTVLKICVISWQVIHWLTVSSFSFPQMIQVAWLFYFSKFIELLDTVRTCFLFLLISLDCCETSSINLNLSLADWGFFFPRFSLCWGRNKVRSHFSMYSITPSCPGRGGGASPWLPVRFTWYNVKYTLLVVVITLGPNTSQKQRLHINLWWVIHIIAPHNPPKVANKIKLVRLLYCCKKMSHVICFLLSFQFSSRRNGLLSCNGECNSPRYHVFLLWTFCCRPSLPEIPVVEEVHDCYPACMSFFFFF